MRLLKPNPGPIQPELLRNAAAFEAGAVRARITAAVERAAGREDVAELRDAFAQDSENLAALLRRAALALREGDPTSSAHFLLCERCAEPLKIRRTIYREDSRRLTSWFYACTSSTCSSSEPRT